MTTNGWAADRPGASQIRARHSSQEGSQVQVSTLQGHIPHHLPKAKTIATTLPHTHFILSSLIPFLSPKLASPWCCSQEGGHHLVAGPHCP